MFTIGQMQPEQEFRQFDRAIQLEGRLQTAQADVKQAQGNLVRLQQAIETGMASLPNIPFNKDQGAQAYIGAISGLTNAAIKAEQFQHGERPFPFIISGFITLSLPLIIEKLKKAWPVEKEVSKKPSENLLKYVMINLFLLNFIYGVLGTGAIAALSNWFGKTNYSYHMNIKQNISAIAITSFVFALLTQIIKPLKKTTKLSGTPGVH